LRTDAAKQEPKEFQALLRDGESAAEALENELKQWKDAGQTAPPPKSIGEAFERVTANCKTCHVAYRDVPLSEKKNNGR
jgi:cytochrome c556